MIIFLVLLSIIAYCGGLYLASIRYYDFLTSFLAVISFILSFIAGFTARDTVKYFESDKKVQPNIIIKTTEINGVKQSDTTYIYKRER